MGDEAPALLPTNALRKLKAVPLAPIFLKHTLPYPPDIVNKPSAGLEFCGGMFSTRKATAELRKPAFAGVQYGIS
jgi:hypothetical protein